MTQAADPTSAIAAFLHENCGEEVPTLLATVRERWPYASQEQIGRAAKTAAAMSRAEAAEYFAKADALEQGDTSLLTAEDWAAIKAWR
jgi:hypothetical protein